jgi:hypothetical protein
MRSLLAAAILAGVILVSGCASGVSSRFVRTGPLPVATTPDGRLSSGPVALTLADVTRFPPHSPERVVMRILFDIEWGYASDAVVRVDPAIVRVLGAKELMSAFRLMRGMIVAGYPVIGRLGFFGKGVVVNVSLLSSDHAPAHHVFVLRRTGGHWNDVYDSTLLSGVALAAENRIQSLSRPLSQRAFNAGNQAQVFYRKRASSLLRGGPLPGPSHA